MNIYNLNITLHGLLMIFYLVMPGLFSGFGNILLPIYLGAPEVTHPRINNITIISILLSFLSLLTCIGMEYSIGTGWTLYPPLSTSLISLSSLGLSIVIYSLLLLGVSSTLTSFNFFITYVYMTSNGMILSTLSVFIWSINITTSMLLFVLPILSGALTMLISDIHYNTSIFDSLFGGDPVFYQHLFWFFGHPEVYILIIPSFGLISLCISGLIQVIMFGNMSMILAISCISIIGNIVWSHHMFTVGLISDTSSYFSSVTMIISIPTGSKIFNWLSTYLVSKSLISISTIFYVPIFIIMFSIGGSTGIILSSNVMDIVLHDSYYVVSHFHLVLSISVIISLLSGISILQDHLLTYLSISLTGSINNLDIRVTFSIIKETLLIYLLQNIYFQRH